MHPLASLPRLGALAMAAAILVAGCGADSGTRSPTPFATVDPSPVASPSTPPAGTRTPTDPATPTSPPWPAGWESAMCDLFAETVVMQELAVDIGRALDEDARADARGLTAELAAQAASVREQLAGLPEWEAAAPFERQLGNLLDLADRMANRYERHFETDRSRPLQAAREAGAEMSDVVPRLLDRLDTLVQAGLSCPDVEFSLETPPEP